MDAALIGGEQTAIAHHLRAAWVDIRMLACWHWYCKEADGADLPLRSLQPLAVQPLVLELGRALLACLLVDLAVGLLTVNTAVLD